MEDRKEEEQQPRRKSGECEDPSILVVTETPRIPSKVRNTDGGSPSKSSTKKVCEVFGSGVLYNFLQDFAKNSYSVDRFFDCGKWIRIQVKNYTWKWQNLKLYFWIFKKTRFARLKCETLIVNLGKVWFRINISFEINVVVKKVQQVIRGFF